MTFDMSQAHDVLHRALEADLAAVAVYDAAIGVATHEDLREAWQRHREAKRGVRRQLESAMRALAVDPQLQTASRHVVRHLGQSLAAAVKMAGQSGSRAMAELVGAECVLQAELASRRQWSLVARVARSLPGEAGAALRTLALGVEPEQEQQIELAERWLDELAHGLLGLPAALPVAPPALPGDGPAPPPMRLRSDIALREDTPRADGPALAS